MSLDPDDLVSLPALPSTVTSSGSSRKRPHDTDFSEGIARRMAKQARIAGVLAGRFEDAVRMADTDILGSALLSGAVGGTGRATHQYNDQNFTNGTKMNGYSSDLSSGFPYNSNYGNPQTAHGPVLGLGGLNSGASVPSTRSTATTPSPDGPGTTSVSAVDYEDFKRLVEEIVSAARGGDTGSQSLFNAGMAADDSDWPTTRALIEAAMNFIKVSDDLQHTPSLLPPPPSPDLTPFFSLIRSKRPIWSDTVRTKGASWTRMGFPVDLEGMNRAVDWIARVVGWGVREWGERLAAGTAEVPEIIQAAECGMQLAVETVELTGKGGAGEDMVLGADSSDMAIDSPSQGSPLRASGSITHPTRVSEVRAMAIADGSGRALEALRAVIEARTVGSWIGNSFASHGNSTIFDPSVSSSTCPNFALDRLASSIVQIGVFLAEQAGAARFGSGSKRDGGTGKRILRAAVSLAKRAVEIARGAEEEGRVLRLEVAIGED
ncbi:hypothetical protein HDU93_001548 [Gonapodya sp. JEL0774]|nr:hypothetical protein HDU93_001548 [Gonapodya sp. JEL0774]